MIPHCISLSNQLLGDSFRAGSSDSSRWKDQEETEVVYLFNE